MNNRDYVRGAYDEIHAPDALFGKVMDMKNKEVKKFDKRNVLKYAAAFMAFAIAFAGSNGICYAATGETWVEKAYVYINGEKQEVDMTWSQDGDTLVGQAEITTDDGVVCEVVEIPNEDGDIVVDDVVMEFTDSNVDEFAVNDDGTSVVISQNNVPQLKNEDGKVYLVVADETVDITEDFADGEATGEIKYDGKVVGYTITGRLDEHQIELIEK
ncbi:MAG: hypothetical protein J6A59_05040 [Lachnospiraceae bacterium]|nr:hypothetical protein [Lachnospiraceae bacterium]